MKRKTSKETCGNLPREAHDACEQRANFDELTQFEPQ